MSDRTFYETTSAIPIHENKNGETHYYEIVTDQNGETATDGNSNKVYAEIVTDKDKNYVTNKSTTVFNDDTKDASLSETNKTNSADNEVTFNQPDATTTQEPTTHIINTTESTTQKRNDHPICNRQRRLDKQMVLML